MKKHADIELGHSAYTDNANLAKKVALRKEATKELKELRVLDLFAGENLIWSKIKTDRYFGVEAEKGKGKNLNVDNRRIIPVLDLSDFNVIDCDAYGIPYEQISMIFDNPTLRKGTVIIYTCITGVLNRICVKALKDFDLQENYKRSRVLYNKYSRDMFFEMLRRNGVKKVISYRDDATMQKEYGYFIV